MPEELNQLDEFNPSLYTLAPPGDNEDQPLPDNEEETEESDPPAGGGGGGTVADSDPPAGGGGGG